MLYSWNRHQIGTKLIRINFAFAKSVSTSVSLRFHCIVLPFRERFSLPKASAIIIVVWLFSVAIMCPSAIMLTVGQLEGHYMVLGNGKNATYPLYTCYEAWSDDSMRKLYTTILFVHIYLVPLTLIVFMYGRVCLKLCNSTVPVTEHLPCANRANGTSKKRIKVIKMLILVALLFMISWLPLWTLMLLVDYTDLADDHLNLLTSYFFPFAHWLAFSNSSINPVIYGYYNENFRRSFQAAFKFQSCSQEMTLQEPYSEHPLGPINKIFTQANSSNSSSSPLTHLSSRKTQPKYPSPILEDMDKIMTYHVVNQAWKKTRT